MAATAPAYTAGDRRRGDGREDDRSGVDDGLTLTSSGVTSTSATVRLRAKPPPPPPPPTSSFCAANPPPAAVAPGEDRLDQRHDRPLPRGGCGPDHALAGAGDGEGLDDLLRPRHLRERADRFAYCPFPRPSWSPLGCRSIAATTPIGPRAVHGIDSNGPERRRTATGADTPSPPPASDCSVLPTEPRPQTRDLHVDALRDRQRPHFAVEAELRQPRHPRTPPP